MKTLTKLAVGGPSPIPFPGQDGLYLEWRKNVPATLFIYLADMTAEELQGIKSGLEFALPPVQGIIFLVVQTRKNAPPYGFSWSEAPYSVHLLQQGERPEIPAEITGESRLVLTVLAIDSRSNTLKAIKACTFSPPFSQRFYQALREQEGVEWKGQREYDRTLAGIQQRYSPEALAKMSVATCVSGD